MAGSVVATYTDTATGGAVVDVTVADLLYGDTVVVIAANAYGATPSTVSSTDVAGSFTELGVDLGSPEDPNYRNQRLRAWRLDAQSPGQDSGDAHFSTSNVNENVLVVVHCRGVAHAVAASVSDHVDGQTGGVATTQAIGPVTGTVNGLLIGAWAGIKFGAYTWGPVTSMTETAELADPANTQRLMVSHQILPGSGTTGTRTSVASGSIGGGFAGKLIALVPGNPPPVPVITGAGAALMAAPAATGNGTATAGLTEGTGEAVAVALTATGRGIDPPPVDLPLRAGAPTLAAGWSAGEATIR